MAESNSQKKHSHFSEEGRAGEHPYGDRGQLICLLVFLVIWILDSFVLKFLTFPSDFVPLYVRLIAAGLILLLAVYLIRSGHRAVSHEVVSSSQLLIDGAFARVRHPIYLAMLLFYCRSCNNLYGIRCSIFPEIQFTFRLSKSHCLCRKTDRRVSEWIQSATCNNGILGV